MPKPKVIACEKCGTPLLWISHINFLESSDTDAWLEINCRNKKCKWVTFFNLRLCDPEIQYPVPPLIIPLEIAEKMHSQLERYEIEMHKKKMHCTKRKPE